MASCTYNPNINSVNPYAVLNVTQQSQNIASNKTVVRWELLLYRPSAIYSSAAKSYSVVVNGSTVASGSTTIGGSGTKTIASGTLEIPHNSDGTKSISFSFSLTFEIKWNVGYIGTGSASGSMTLSTIPRASSIASVSGEYIGKPVSVNIARHASFTHQVWYRIGSSAWVDCGKGHATSCTFTVPLDMCKYIPDKPMDIVQICLRTYSGSTQIGSDVYYEKHYIRVPDDVIPILNKMEVLETTEGLAEKFGGFVQSKSAVRIKSDVVGAYGSSIKTCDVYLNKSFVAQGVDVKSGILADAGTATIRLEVTDSRYHVAIFEKEIDVIDYSPPQVSTFIVDRVNDSGEEDGDGTHAKIRLNMNISPVNDKNDSAYKIEYQEQGGKSWGLIGEYHGYAFDGVIDGGNILHPDNSYLFRITLTDFFGDVPIDSNHVPTAFTLIDFNRSGRSIKFGGVSTRAEDEKAVDFAMDLYDKFGARINNGLARYTGSGEKGIDPDTTSEELILTDVKTPIGSMMYIRTMHYLEKDADANRAQIAYPYSSDDAIYSRYFLNGAWSEWKKYVSSEDVGMFSIGLLGKSSDLDYPYSGTVGLEKTALQDTTGGKITPLYGFVRIGKGVEKIAVSGQLFVQNKVSGYQWFSLIKVHESNLDGDFYEYIKEVAQCIQSSNANQYLTINFAEKIVDVKEGDVFGIYKKEEKACFIRKHYECSYLTFRIVQ